MVTTKGVRVLYLLLEHISNFDRRNMTLNE